MSRNRIREIKCGIHSGFSLCCVLSFVTIWKWTWYRNWVWKKLDRSENTLNGIDYIMVKTNGRDKIVDYRIIENFKSWGMIPCLWHMWRKKRNPIKTCFCGFPWTVEAKEKLMANHKHMVVDE